MNLLYCGDANILDGLIISILSILKNTKASLHIYVLTMRYKDEKKTYKPLSPSNIKVLDAIIKKKNKDNFITYLNNKSAKKFLSKQQSLTENKKNKGNVKDNDERLL